VSSDRSQILYLSIFDTQQYQWARWGVSVSVSVSGFAKVAVDYRCIYETSDFWYYGLHIFYSNHIFETQPSTLESSSYQSCAYRKRKKKRKGNKNLEVIMSERVCDCECDCEGAREWVRERGSEWGRERDEDFKHKKQIDIDEDEDEDQRQH